MTWPTSLPSGRSMMPAAHQRPLKALPGPWLFSLLWPPFLNSPRHSPSGLRPSPLRDFLGFEELLPSASGCGVSEEPVGP